MLSLKVIYPAEGTTCVGDLFKKSNDGSFTYLLEGGIVFPRHNNIDFH